MPLARAGGRLLNLLIHDPSGLSVSHLTVVFESNRRVGDGGFHSISRHFFFTPEECDISRVFLRKKKGM